MRTFTLLIALVAAAPLLTGCATPRGKTLGEKRDFVMNMHDQTLKEFYASKPELRTRVQQAAGYGVFSNVGIHALVLATGHGYGVLVDNRDGAQTYMRMAEVGAGLGAGLKDLRAVFIFPNRTVFEEFRDKGWQFGTQAQAAARAGDKGAAAGGQASVSTSGAAASGEGEAGGGSTHDTRSTGIQVYRVTKAGVALQATLSGTKYWKDTKLND